MFEPKKKVHCLFEQSGTFKKVFQQYGYEAYDYDILNDFNETDYKIDLYYEILKAYTDYESIFDKFSKDDLIIAFFPCTRFENQIYMHFQGTAKQLQKWSLVQKLEYDLKLHEELFRAYNLITKLAIVCARRGLKCIIENPYSKEHYLTRYWALRATIIDMDRTENGDYYKKPTQYFFINLQPHNNLIFEPVIDNKVPEDIVHVNDKVKRSLISPQYADRFVKRYIL